MSEYYDPTPSAEFEVYLDTDGDGSLETVLTGSDAAPFPVEPTP